MSLFGDFDSEYETLARIASDLANNGDPISPGISACALCGVYEPKSYDQHETECAYRRAVEWQRLNKSVVD